MTAENVWQRKEVLECVRVSRKDSSPNILPSETLDVTCKSLVKHTHHRIDRYLRSTQNEILTNSRLSKIIIRQQEYSKLSHPSKLL